jgi:hypothetical protein
MPITLVATSISTRTAHVGLHLEGVDGRDRDSCFPRDAESKGAGEAVLRGHRGTIILHVI